MNGYRARRSVLLDYDSESGGSEAAARSPAKVEDGYTLLCEHSLRPVAQVPSIGNILLTNTFGLRVSWVCTYVCVYIYMCMYTVLDGDIQWLVRCYLVVGLEMLYAQLLLE